MMIEPGEADAGLRRFGIVTFEAAGEAVPGFVVGDLAYDLRPILPGVRSTGDLFARWDASLDAIEQEAQAEMAAARTAALAAPWPDPSIAWDDVQDAGAVREAV